MNRNRVVKRAIALILSVLMLIAVTPLATFADNVAGHWSMKWIREAQELRWIPSGDLGANFDIDNFIARKEMALILWQAYGAPDAEGNSPYIDVDADTYFGNAFAFLYDEGIILGYGDRIAGPDDYVTREMIFTVLARLYKASAKSEATYEKYWDYEEVSDWAREPISALSEMNIVEGDENGYVHPLDYITFAEYIKVLIASYELNIDDPLNPLGPNTKAPLSISQGNRTYTKGGEEEIKEPETPPAGPAIIPPSTPGGGSGTTGGGQLPPRGSDTPTRPPDQPEYDIAILHLADLTWIVIETNANINTVTVSTTGQSEPASKKYGLNANGKQEWRAMLDGTVQLPNITVTLS